MTFEHLNINPKIKKTMLKTLESHGFINMTMIQEKALPSILMGSDVIAQAKTGSGKTLAFGLGVFQRLERNKKLQSLILCPTKELANQVTQEMRKLAKHTENLKVLTIIGGTPFNAQKESLRHGAEIIVGTPGRVLKHLNKNSFNLEFLKTLVIDEAHIMLDMGFIEEIKKIIRYAPKKRQTLLFSATFTEEILQLSQSIQRAAIKIETIQEEEPNKIKEYFFKTTRQAKFSLIFHLLSEMKPKSLIVFTNTKAEAKNIEKYFRRQDLDAIALHGDLQAFERRDVFTLFKNNSASILIATDVASRGLNIKDLDLVINFELPNDHATYVHRIGRTGRAEQEGVAITLYEQENFKLEPYQVETSLFNPEELLENYKNRKELSYRPEAKYTTLVIEGGKKNKLRAGDLVGAILHESQITFQELGKIEIYETQAYVAIKKEAIDKVYHALRKGKIKGKKYPVWIKRLDVF